MAKHDKNRQPTLGDADARPGAGVGTILRGARLTRDEELREVSAALRVRLPYLQAIEDGKIEDLPGITYGIGFVRAYAEHLGLDSEDIVTRFKTEVRGLDRKTTLQFPEPLPGNRVPGGALILIVLLLAGSVYGGWLYTSSQNMTLVEAIEEVPKRLLALVEDSEIADSDQTAATPPSEAPLVEPSEAPSAAPAATTPDATTDKPTTSEPQTATDEAADTTTAQDGADDAVAQSTEPATAETTTDAAPAQADATTPVVPTELPTEEPQTEPLNATQDSDTAASSTETDATTPPAVTTAQDDPADPAAPAAATETAVEDAAPDAAPAPETITPPPAETATDVAATEPDTATAAPAPDPAPATPQATEQPAQTDAPAVADASSPEDVPTAPAEQDAAQSTLNSDIVEEELLPPPAPPEPSTDAATPTTPDTAVASVTQEPAAPTDRIFIQATSESWIQVKRPNGDVLVEKLMLPGEFYRVPSHSGLILNTGNAGALKLIVNGTTIPPIGESGEVVRGVSLDADALLR